MLKPLNKMELYRITHWFSLSCEKIIKELEENGLCIINKSDLDEINERELRCMDDGK